MGVGAVFSKGAQMLAKGMIAGARGEMLLNAGAQGMTALTLAYAEGAMTGADVYKSTYDKAIKAGKSERESQEIAAKSAATSVQINTIINTALNMTSTKGFMRPYSKAKIMNKKHVQMVGESAPDYAKRLKAMPDVRRSKAEIAKTLGIEAVQESAEEIVNEIASGLGDYRGEKLIGILNEEDKTNGWTGRVVETLAQEQTWLAAILGAVGGVGQTAAVSQTKNAKAQRLQEKTYEQSQINHIVSKIDDHEAAFKKMAEANKNGDKQAYKEAMFEIFGTQAFDSFVTGTQDQVSMLYKQMADMTPEDAEAAGFDIDPESKDYYKTRANEAIEDVKTLHKVYDETVHKYNAYDEEARNAHFGERVFQHQVYRHGVEKHIDEVDGDIAEAEIAMRKSMDRRGFGKYSYEELMKAQTDRKIDELVHADIQRELQQVRAIKSRSEKFALAKKYGYPPKGTTYQQHAIDVLNKRAAKLRERTKKNDTRLNTTIKNFEKNHGEIGGVYDIDSKRERNLLLDSLYEESAEKANVAEAKAYREKITETLRNTDKAIAELTSEEGKAAYIKEAQKEAKKAIKEDDADGKRETNKEEIKESREGRKEAAKTAKEKREKAAQERAEEKGGPVVPVNPEGESENQEDGESDFEQDVQEEDGPDVEGEQNAKVDEEEKVGEETVEELIEESENDVTTTEREDGDVRTVDTKTIAGVQASYDQAKEPNSVSDFLVVPAANTFAYLSKPYQVDGGRKITTTSEKKDTLHKELESQKHFRKGDDVTLEIDTNATWVDDTTGVTHSYSDFVKDGVVDVANVPIVVKDANGTIVAHVRTQEWIKRVNGPNYVNVADSSNHEDPMYRNAEKQAMLNMAIRNHVFKNGATPTKVKFKSAGFLSIAYEDGNRVKNPMVENTPGIKTITVVKNGQFHTSKGEVFHHQAGKLNSKEFLEGLNQVDGMVYIPIPSPNGKVLMTPVSIPTLDSGQINAIMKSLEMHYSNNEAGAKETEEKIGLSPLSPGGMFEILKALTFVSSDGEALFQKRVDGEGSDEGRHLSFDKDSKFAGPGKTVLRFANHARNPIVIKNIEDFKENEEALTQFFEEKLFSVSLTRINKSVEISGISSDAEGNIVALNYENYNEYVKEHLLTDVIGTPINDTEFSYFDQPVIGFDTEFTGQPSLDVDPTDTRPKPPTTPTEPEVKTDDTEDSEVESTEEATTKAMREEQLLVTSGIIENLDKDGHPCFPDIARNGARPDAFTRGSKWEIIEDLKGYPSHAKGGVDLRIGSDGVTFKSAKGVDIKAKNGLVISKRK
jgi:hypothetical protein